MPQQTPKAQANWTPEQVIALVEKGVGLVIEMVRTWRAPDVVLKRIVDRTQELRDQRRAIDEELREKYNRGEAE